MCENCTTCQKSLGFLCIASRVQVFSFEADAQAGCVLEAVLHGQKSSEHLASNLLLS